MSAASLKQLLAVRFSLQGIPDKHWLLVVKGPLVFTRLSSRKILPAFLVTSGSPFDGGHHLGI